MGLLSTLKWKLTPADKKLAILKKRGLTIGGGARSSMVMNWAPSHGSSPSGTTFA